MYKASEVREFILKELQKCGYSCVKKNDRSFYVLTEKCDYIFFQKIGIRSNGVVFDIVIKGSLYPNAEIIDSYTVFLDRTNFESDFKKKVVDDLVKSGYLEEKEMIKDSELLSEEDIKILFDIKLKAAMAEENVYNIPQTIKEERRNFTTYFEYMGYDIFGMEYRVSYVAKVIVESYGVNGELYDTRVKEYVNKSVPLAELKDSFVKYIKILETEGFIEEKSVSIAYNEFVDLIISGGMDEETLKKAFDMAYNKGKDDGSKMLCRAFTSMNLPHLK